MTFCLIFDKKKIHHKRYLISNPRRGSLPKQTQTDVSTIKINKQNIRVVVRSERALTPRF